MQILQWFKILDSIGIVLCLAYLVLSVCPIYFIFFYFFPSKSFFFLAFSKIYSSFFSLLPWKLHSLVTSKMVNHKIMTYIFVFLFFFLVLKFYFILLSLFFISWRLITLHYCSGFCHTLTWISHGLTCIPRPDPPSHLLLYPIPLGLPGAPGPSTCLMHPTRAGDLFHPRQYTCFDAVLWKHPTLTFSQGVQKSVLYICVSFCFAYRVIITIFLNSIYMC